MRDRSIIPVAAPVGVALSARRGAVSAQAARLVARTILVAALVGLAWSGVTSTARADGNPQIGDTTVFANVPYPGHPGGIVVDGNTVYVDTFNPVDRASDDYDAIFTYNLATGALRSDRPNPIKVPRMMSPAIMGLAAMALDAKGRLYVADMNGRIVRVDPKTGAQSDYATFPTNTMTSVTNMPAGISFDDEGDLYVTDASAPIIWRVPPGRRGQGLVRRPGSRRRVGGHGTQRRRDRPERHLPLLQHAIHLGHGGLPVAAEPTGDLGA